MNDLQKKVFDSAKFYGKSFLPFDYILADYGFKTIKPFFKGETALELGPASGFMTKLLVKEFKTLDLVEGSADLLNEIPDHPNVTKHCSFFENFSTDQLFDTIIMSHVLEHIADPVFVLSKVKTWLKNDGVLIISVPNAKSLHRLAAVEMGLLKSPYELNERDHQLGHYRVYSLDILQDDILKAGFTIVEKGGYFLKPVSNGQIESHWTREMIDGFYKLGQKFSDHCAEIFVVCSI
jgi:SAM-dependent methyltransferase